MEEEIKAKFVDTMGKIDVKVLGLANSARQLTKLDIEYEAILDEGIVDRLQTLKEKLNKLARKLLLHQGLPQYTEKVLVNDSTINLQVLDTLDDSYARFDTELDSIMKSRTKASKIKPVRLELTQVDEVDKPIICFKAEQQLRPQIFFKEKVDTGYLSGHVSKVYHKGIKYNAKNPLTQEELKLKDIDLTEISLEQAESLPHPYEMEIRNLELNLDPTPLIADPPKAIEADDYTFVENEEELDLMLENLKKADLIAVDLEYHDFRSYSGFVCLMQITANGHDYVVDTLNVRSELFKLNQVFTDPNIVKVFHGASSDILWLQQDFSLYVVNFFDTYFATKHLGFSKHSLSYLLARFCNVRADKQYQLADWRIRPLPLPMLNYARSDTHYLPYIYAMLRNQLVESSNPQTLNLLKSTLEDSNDLSLRKFIKPKLDIEEGPGRGWNGFLTKYRLNLNPRQFMALKLLFGWRDRIAREMDESVSYVLPFHHLFDLTMKLPTNPAEVLKVIYNPSPALRMNLTEVAELIISTKDALTTTNSNPPSTRQVAPNNLPDTIQIHTNVQKVDAKYLNHLAIPYPIKAPASTLTVSSSEQLILKQSVGLPPTNQLNLKPSDLTKLGQIYSNLKLNFLPDNVIIHEKLAEDDKVPDTIQPETHQFQPPIQPEILVLQHNSGFKNKVRTQEDIAKVAQKQSTIDPSEPVDLTNESDSDVQFVSAKRLSKLSGSGKDYQASAVNLTEQLQLNPTTSKKSKRGKKSKSLAFEAFTANRVSGANPSNNPAIRGDTNNEGPSRSTNNNRNSNNNGSRRPDKPNKSRSMSFR